MSDPSHLARAIKYGPPYQRTKTPYNECPHCGEYRYKTTQVSEDGDEWQDIRKECDNCKYKGEEDE